MILYVRAIGTTTSGSEFIANVWIRKYSIKNNTKYFFERVEGDVGDFLALSITPAPICTTVCSLCPKYFYRLQFINTTRTLLETGLKSWKMMRGYMRGNFKVIRDAVQYTRQELFENILLMFIKWIKNPCYVLYKSRWVATLMTV